MMLFDINKKYERNKKQKNRELYNKGTWKRNCEYKNIVILVHWY